MGQTRTHRPTRTRPTLNAVAVLVAVVVTASACAQTDISTSSPPADPALVVMPDVTCQTLGDAQALLDTLDLNSFVIPVEQTTSGLDNDDLGATASWTVTGQEPAAGHVIDEPAAVTLTVDPRANNACTC